MDSKKETVTKTNEKIAMTVSRNSVFVNVVLSLFKLFAGIFAHSGAMVTDAVHSASDVFSTFIVMIGYKISSKESDTKHQFGHERLECVASIILAMILALTGLGIGVNGLKVMVTGDYENLMIPGVLALAAAFVSIITKEAMYHYTKRAAKKINSGALMADAWHHRSDALSSIGSLAGVAGARMGFPICDPLVSVLICFLIIYASCEIFKDAVDKMVDKACDEETVKQIERVVSEQEGVLKIDDIKTRLFGARIYVETEISVDGNQTLYAAHEIAQNVHDRIEEAFPDVKHCMVHVNPKE